MSDPNYEDLSSWEDYDESLTYQENLIELQILMGFLDEAREVIKIAKED